jgi:hypothetical protein
MVITLDSSQEAALQRRATSLGTTPEDALNQLLYSPIPPRRWTDEEDSYVRNMRNSPRAIQAKFPHRTTHAISVRRNRLLGQDLAPLEPGPLHPDVRAGKREETLEEFFDAHPGLRSSDFNEPNPPTTSLPLPEEHTEPCPYCLPAKPNPTCQICSGTGEVPTLSES